MIEITTEDITIERVQYNPDPAIGNCDVCKQARASWEMDFGWKRKFPYQVPLSVAHAFVCDACHASERKALEFIRAYFEKQASYKADRIRRVQEMIGAFGPTPSELGEIE